MSQQGQYLDEDVIKTLEGNSGGKVGPDTTGNISVIGDNTQGIDISGNPATNTLTVTAFDATTTQKGVVELATNTEAITGTASTNKAIIPSSLTAKLGTQTQYGVGYGDGSTNALQWTTAGDDGQLVIGATGAAPAFADLTSTGGTITITPGANSLNIETSAAVSIQFDADSGSAFPSSGIINMVGGTNITSSASGNSVTYDLDSNVTGLTSLEVDNLRLDGNTISSTDTNGDINLTPDGDGSVVITTNATGSIDLDNLSVNGNTLSSTDTNGDITLSPDGTGVVNISYATQYAIPYFEASGEITEVGPLTDGQVIIGATGAAPAASTLTPGTNVSITNGTNSITINANTEDQVVNITSLDNTDSPYTALSTDYYFSCDVSGGTLTIDLPDSPTTGRVFVVKDSGGNANTNNITVTTTGGAVTIDGSTTYVLATDYQATQFIFNGTSYEVF